VWADETGTLIVVRLAEGQSGWSLLRHGAILVSGSGLPASCLNFIRT
jgi:hypothetical protein